MKMNFEDILQLHRTRRHVVMGVINVTPDSFSDGGEHLAPHAAIACARRLLAEGADVLDVGAESTRPGSERVPAAEQIRRLEPVLAEIVSLGVCVSIDTTSAEVAEFALDAGASIINDVAAGRDDPDILPLAARRDASVILMHMAGQPKTMQTEPHYDDVVRDVTRFLAERLEAASAAGVPRERCLVDPGIGFGKTLEHNLTLLREIPRLCELGVPVLVGPSRKRFISAVTGQEAPQDRLGGTIAACLAAWGGGATVFRVHDVAQVHAALQVAAAIGDTFT